MSGLTRYDGNNFKTYKHNAEDKSTVSDNFVRSIAELPDKKMWIETRAGINIYNPVSEVFEHDIQSELKKYDIEESNIKFVKKTRSGLFWFISGLAGLHRYDPASKKTMQIAHHIDKEKTISSSLVKDIVEDSRQNVWIVHADGILEMLKPNSDEVIRRLDLSDKFSNRESHGYRLFIDQQGILWIYNMYMPTGIYAFDPVKNSWKKLSKTSRGMKLSADMVLGVIEDKQGRIWIGTDHGGLNIINKQRSVVKYLVNKEDDNKSLSQNSISSLFYDRSDVVWIGTFRQGVNFYHPSIIKFNLIKHSSDSNSLVYNDINKIVEDKNGNLWVGANGKGLVYFNRKTQKFTTYRHDPNRPSSLSHDAVVGLYLDRYDKLWIGTYTGGFDCLENGSFVHHKNNPSDPKSLSDNRVADFFEDSRNRFWVATMGGGLNLFDRKTKKFQYFNQAANKISSDFVFKILEDSKRNIWIGTSFGMNLLPNRGTRFLRMINQAGNKNSLINDNVNSFIEDHRGYIWIGTREGLSIYEPKTRRFHNYTMAAGLPDNNVVDLQEDAHGDVWLSTSNGLSKISVEYRPKLRLVFTNFNEHDGLQGREFNRNASVKLSTGELAFGGSDGMNIFQPSQIKTFSQVSNLFITDFQLFNKSVAAGMEVGGRKILQHSIFDTDALVLNHDQNVFTIEFASLNYIDSHRAKHQYMLEGFDQDWITANNDLRKATYTNLGPGNYVFKVRASRTENMSAAVPVTLSIRILNPWYTSTVAYISYLIVAAAALYYFRYKGIKKIRREFATEHEKAETQRLLDQERREAMRNRELDALKIKFLTNVSHEFRTPLSLILAPMEKLSKGNYDEAHQEQVSMIQKNAKRLLNLVNQLLDSERWS